MKADEQGQRTSFLLLPPKELIREVRRRELALVDNFANAIRTVDIKAYAQSLGDSCSIPSVAACCAGGRVSRPTC